MDGADGVYPSSEDTFLLIDALRLDSEVLHDSQKNGLCVEIGCGSGEVSEALSSVMGQSMCFCTDVNSLATGKTKALLATGSSKSDVMRCDMFTAFRQGVLFDVILFNPPYVPTDEDELVRSLTNKDISASWAGGRDGREVIDRFLAEFLPFLRKGGFTYLVVLEANDPAQVAYLAEERGCTVTTVIKRKAGMEQLYILRFQKN